MEMARERQTRRSIPAKATKTKPVVMFAPEYTKKEDVVSPMWHRIQSGEFTGKVHDRYRKARESTKPPEARRFWGIKDKELAIEAVKQFAKANKALAVRVIKTIDGQPAKDGVVYSTLKAPTKAQIEAAEKAQITAGDIFCKYGVMDAVSHIAQSLQTVLNSNSSTIRTNPELEAALDKAGLAIGEAYQVAGKAFFAHQEAIEPKKAEEPVAVVKKTSRRR